MLETVITKPKLSSEEQIAHLKKKGVKFNIHTEEYAKHYLNENNNYFKLRAYRKSFKKYTAGEKSDTYIDLDFAMLKDLAIIDMRLRYLLLSLALDIEHFEKVKLLKIISDSDNDGYSIVNAYIESLREFESSTNDGNKPYTALMHELNKKRNSEYCQGIVNSYEGNYPVWAFVEIIPFGCFISFIRFCAEYFDDKNLKDDFYLLHDVKRLRNAAAHNNCIIHDLNINNSEYKPNYNVSRFVSTLPDMSKSSRQRRMSNATMRDIVTLLYAHKRIVTSRGVIDAKTQEINNVMSRCFKHIDYYENNTLIVNTFNFLKKTVDNLYPL
ncbi:MAG: Abi family protein [Clostridia bacterium]|nr:Abi family protein [Clostridia bacterium]